MSEGHIYTAIKSEALMEKRAIVRYSKAALEKDSASANRTFVPFSGFDGQALAGTGALVFEGELLDLRH